MEESDPNILCQLRFEHEDRSEKASLTAVRISTKCTSKSAELAGGLAWKLTGGWSPLVSFCNELQTVSIHITKLKQRCESYV